VARVRIVGAQAGALLAAGIMICGVRSTFAEDLVNGSKVEHFLYFSGFDLWRAGGFAHGGVLWSPDGLGRTGFTFKLLIGGGSYFYNSGATKIRGNQLLAAAMPGWRFVHDHTELTIYAGVDVQSHRFTPDDPLNRLRGDHVGFRVGADLWSEPINGFMLTASISGSTIGPNVWGRAASGVRLFDRFWVGPEIEMFSDGHYEELRAGGHVTALKTGRFEWSAGFGCAIDSDRRVGPYGRIGLLMRQ
jgi:hypothetical protein